MGAFYLQSHAQTTLHVKKAESVTIGAPGGGVSVTVLLADETTLIYGKTEAIIDCCNEDVAKVIIQKWDQLIKRYSCSKKKDRHGVYKQYFIYLNKDDAALIINWAKNNL
jgi:hypothetical protein